MASSFHHANARDDNARLSLSDAEDDNANVSSQSEKRGKKDEDRFGAMSASNVQISFPRTY